MTNSNTIGNKTKYKLFTSIGVFFLILLVGSAFFFYNINARESDMRNGRVRMEAYNSRIDNEEGFQSTLTKAKKLRDGWHQWASLHKDLVSKMLKSNSQDTDLLDSVLTSLPKVSNLETSGIPFDEFNLNSQFPFSWQPLGMSSTTSNPMADPIANEKFQKGEQNQKLLIHQNFDKYHDVMLSVSMKPGRRAVTLWVSGRITQETLVSTTDKSGTTSHFTTTELIPPYDDITH